ncbi:MAG: DNA translocase FtsK [Armatimonadota bacterium]
METTTRPRARRTRSKTSSPPPRPFSAPTAVGRGEPERSITADLLAIGMGLVGALLAISLWKPGSAGVVGTFLVHFVRLWMGHCVWVAPLLFLGTALGMALDYRRATNLQMVLGVTGLLALLFGWMHLISSEHASMWATTGARFAAILGRAHEAELVQRADGGLFGALVMFLMTPLGRWGSYITLLAVGFASVLLITELTLRTIFERVHERSVIAAEGARRSAGAMREKARDVAASLPALPMPRRQSLFLDLRDDEDDEEGEEDEEPEAAAPARRVREPERSRPLRRTTERDEESRPARKEKEPELLALPFAEAAIASAPVEEPVPDTAPAPRPKVSRAGRASRGEETVVARAASESTPDFVMPPLDLLDPPHPRPKRAGEEAEANISTLENTLAQFRIDAQVVEIADGPSVTRYEIRLGEGIRVKKILDLADNIAMSLAAMSVRVEAPIPGKAAIGIEVPKKIPSVVTLKECLESDECNDLKSRVGFVLGKDVGGNVRCADLAKMPHLLVAGATNSGKSVCLNVLIASMLFRAKPEELKMIMIDPKRVELTLYDGIPHLIHPVVKDVKQAAGILRWVLKEMDRRYDLFAHVMTRNIENYNEKMAKEPEKRLPFLVVVIDELADLMMQQGPEVEQAICRLAQLARATGIHLVIATQRPSVDVITGLIKANVPSRISFSVSSQIDSRTILDTKGAENLIGRGDMLFKPIDASKPIRIQGAFLREEEVEALVTYLKKQGRPEYVAEALSVDHGAYGVSSPEESEDELFEPAARFVVTTGHASTSMIQRKFKIGYTRAARLVDMMEARCIVGALDGAKPREILMSRTSLDEMFQGIRESPFRVDRGSGDDDEDEEELAPLADLDDEEEPGEEEDERDPFVDD